jgi:hypothetical protein
LVVRGGEGEGVELGGEEAWRRRMLEKESRTTAAIKGEVVMLLLVAQCCSDENIFREWKVVL